MPDNPGLELLATRVHDMVSQYIYRRTEARSGVEWKELTWTTDSNTGGRRGVPPDKYERYRDAREKVCGDAFLAMRSRRSRQDFVEYFTGTVCSVTQFIPDADYHALAAALLIEGERWEEVRSLAMLTVSSLGRV